MKPWLWGAIGRGLAPFVAIAAAVLLGWIAWHTVAFLLNIYDQEPE